MKARLWCARLMLLALVSVLVFSPLVVRGASATPNPVGWNHDPSSLMLPSSPVYPAVEAYRDVRVEIADRSFEKAEVLLGFANQDAAAIAVMAQRQDFIVSASHASTYRDTFDRCVGWLVIASERGNDVSYLLARVKNDHLAQQAALQQAAAQMPEWSCTSIEDARTHVADVLLQAIARLEGDEALEAYASGIRLTHPELPLPELQQQVPAPAVVVIPPPPVTAESSMGDSAPRETQPPVIVSFDADRKSVDPLESVAIGCELDAEDEDALHYSWWCSRGNLVASGTTATWTAPKRPGVYEINLTVTDDLQRTDSRSIEITVTAPEEEASSDEEEQEDDSTEQVAADAAPEILELVLTADHKYFDGTLGGGYSILVSRDCTIQCVVAEPEALDFHWTANGGGKISGSGDTVTVSVPATPGYVTVTVTTRNSDGEEDSASVRLYVTTCTYCF